LEDEKQPSTPQKRISEFSLPLQWHLDGLMEQGMMLDLSMILVSLCVEIGLLVYHEALNAPLGWTILKGHGYRTIGYLID